MFNPKYEDNREPFHEFITGEMQKITDQQEVQEQPPQYVKKGIIHE